MIRVCAIDMILILSHHGDPHARIVFEYLAQAGQTAEILDLSAFPIRDRLLLSYGRNGTRLRYRLAGGQVLDLNAVGAVWWRRPQPYTVEDGLDAADFALLECEEALAGLWQALPARWMNPPVLDAAAARKSWQLQLATELGLDPPETLITNCPEAALAFVRQLGDVIYKPLGVTQRHWRETRRFGDEELRHIDALRHAPVILQERIEGEDLRVTVVGRQIFAAAIDTTGGNYPTDFRMNHDMVIRPAKLPASVEDAITRLMQRLGLVYGALDFRHCSRSGALRFLEINPAGQWLFVEEQTRQPIARAIAGQLAAMASQAGLPGPAADPVAQIG